MNMSRETNLFLNKILNDFLPPIIRDARWFGWLITRILYKDKAPLFMGFHERVFEMTDAEIKAVYEQVHTTGISRPTDLNEACITAIRKNIVGKTVLEAGSGRGFLSGLLASDGHSVTGCDVAIAQPIRDQYPNVTFQEAYLEKLPFPDNAFDTVVTTHTLEHIRDLRGAFNELRRVAAKRLIIVVPCERPHFYTPNLHVHFFPYRYSFLLAFWPTGTYHLSNEQGDWFYYEDQPGNHG